MSKFKQDSGRILSEGGDPQNELMKHTSAASKRNAKHQGVGSIPLYDEGGEVAPDVKVNADEQPKFQFKPTMPRRASVRETIDDPETNKGIENIYRAAEPSFGLAQKVAHYPELMNTINTNGEINGYVRGSGENDNQHEQHASMAVPKSTLGIIHTHPFGLDVKPSSDDEKAATKIDRPNYVVSGNSIWVAEPGNNNPRKVADIQMKNGHMQYKWANVPIPEPAKLPTYDQGGEVTKQNFDRISSIDIPEPVYAQDQPAAKGSNPNGMTNAFNTAKTYLTEPKFSGGSVGGVQDTALATPAYMPGGGPEMAAPVFDKGGNVNVNDGHHQLAILQEGERVLTPPENARYKKMGLPRIYDDGGEVQPVDDRDKQTAQQRVQNPGVPAISSDVPNKIAEPVRGTPAERQAVQVDKQKAMGQGVKGLSALGLAKIHEAHLEPQPEAQTTNDITLPGSTPRPQPSMGQIAVQGVQDQGAEAQARMPKAAPMDHKAILAQYDQKISQALNLGTPEGQEQADRLSLAKDNYVQQTPWGSANNHPGFWGKLGHIGEEVASRLPVSRAIMNQIPGTEGFRNAQRQATLGRIQAETPLTTQRMGEETKENKGANSEVGKTTQELTFHDLMTGDKGQPRLNPDTQAPYTTQEANVASQGTGKSSDELYIQDQMKQTNPDTNKAFTRREATENLLQLKAGNKPVSRQEQAMKDYMVAQNLADTPTNRDAARIAITRRDVQTKALAALPIQEQRSTFDNNMHQESTLLEQTHADALQRGKSADELQQKENARHEAVVSKLQTAQDTVDSADSSEFAAAIAPVTTLLAVTSAEGVKRVNREELARFVPQNGSLYRWATTHTDQWLAGDIPYEYRKEVGKMLTKLEAQEDREHLSNTHSVDSTIRTGAQTPDNTGKKSTGSIPSEGNNKYHMDGPKGPIFSNDGKTWYDGKGNKIGG